MRIPEFKNVEEMQVFLNKEEKIGATIIQPSDLTPVSYYRPVLECVILPADDVYTSQKKHRIKFTGLTKLGNAAGVEWMPEETCRTDNRNDKMYVSFRAVGGIRKNDGRLYPVKSEYDLDLEIVEEETRNSYENKGKGFGKTGQALEDYVNSNTKRDVIQKRKRKLTLAESGAKARVLRSILGIKSQYDNVNQVVGMPFFVVRFILDHQNPDIKQLFLRAAERSMVGLYGGEPMTALPTPSVADAIDVPVDDDHGPAVEPEPEHEPMKPAGTNERTQTPTEREQFLAFDAQTQGSILDQISKKVGYDIKSFCKQSNVPGPDQLSEAKRIKFYDFLTEEKAA